jgi:integrase/recombinase XerC
MLPTLTQSNAIDGNRLIEAFKRGRSANTLAAYAGDLEAFGDHRGLGPGAAIAELLQGSHGEGNATLLEYRATMLEAKLAPATINRRLSAVRSIVKLARQLGLTDWRPEVDGVKSESYRDTAGPGVDGTRALLKAAKDQHGVKPMRDQAIVRMAFDLALRREEIATLDLAHVDLERRKIWVLGKGKLERAPLTMPVETTQAVRAWIDARGSKAKDDEDALFISLAGSSAGARITGKGIYLVVRELGEREGIRARPHGLRHASITAVLDATGDIRAAQKFARHSNPNTTLAYDDNRTDLGGVAAQRVASILSED